MQSTACQDAPEPCQKDTMKPVKMIFWQVMGVARAQKPVCDPRL